MSVQVPHLAWPLRLGQDGHLAVVEQDTRQDVVQCVRVLLNTPVGYRLLSPEVGVDDPTFSIGIDAAAVEQTLRRDEPRADVAVSADEVDERGHQIVRVQVELANP